MLLPTFCRRDKDEGGVCVFMAVGLQVYDAQSPFGTQFESGVEEDQKCKEFSCKRVYGLWIE